MSTRPETRYTRFAAPGSGRRSPGAVFGHVLLLLIPLLIPAASLRAQLQGGHVSASPGAEAALFPRAAFAPSMPYQDGDTARREGKDPLLAMGLSAVLPGAGQAYTENYWKIPVIWGLGGYWIYEWIRNNDRYRDFRDRYAGSVAASPPYGDERLLSLREFYKDQRDSFTWYLSLLYVLNIADAYIGAHLYDFDVGPDLTDRGTGVHVSIRVNF